MTVSTLHVLMSAVALCALCIFFGLRSLFGNQPHENRQFLDPVPRPWRWFWSPIRAIEPVADALLTRWPPLRARLDRTLQTGGLERSVTAAQLVSGACMLSFAVASVLLVAHYGAGAQPESTLIWSGVAGALFGLFYTQAWVRGQVRTRRIAIVRQLPVVADFIAMCVEAGLPIGAALNQAVERCPAGTLRGEFSQVLRDIKAGRRRPDALQAMADRLNHPAVSQFVLVLNAADREGIGIAKALKAQAEHYRTERFYRAESLAMQAPVKMLLPMILFIFPGTFIVLLFPVLSRLFSEGVFK
jgi:tight adherence protein C